MKTKGLLFNVFLTSILIFVVTSIVTLLWNLYIGKIGAIVDWETSFVFAIILGLVIPIVQQKNKPK